MAERPTIKVTSDKLDDLAKELNANATVADAIALSMAVVHYLGMLDPYALQDIAALADFYAERFGATLYEITEPESDTDAEG